MILRRKVNVQVIRDGDDVMLDPRAVPVVKYDFATGCVVLIQFVPIDGAS